MFAVTSSFAALLTLLYVALTFNVIRTRQRQQVLIGDGGREAMQRALRAHGNFIEYVPLALILMGLLEARHSSTVLLCLLGTALIAGRICHAYSILKVETAREQEAINRRIAYRKAGMILTLGVLIVQAFALFIT